MFFEISAGLKASGAVQVSTPCFFVIKISLGIKVTGKVFENGIAIGVFSKQRNITLFTGQVCAELRHIRHPYTLAVSPSCEICTGWFCGHCKPCLRGLFDKLTYINIFGMPSFETLASTCAESFAFAPSPPPALPRPPSVSPPPSHLPILDESMLCSNPFTYVASCISSCTEWSQCRSYDNMEYQYKFCARHGSAFNCEPCFEQCDSLKPGPNSEQGGTPPIQEPLTPTQEPATEIPHRETPSGSSPQQIPESTIPKSTSPDPAPESSREQTPEPTSLESTSPDPAPEQTLEPTTPESISPELAPESSPEQTPELTFPVSSPEQAPDPAPEQTPKPTPPGQTPEPEPISQPMEPNLNSTHNPPLPLNPDLVPDELDEWMICSNPVCATCKEWNSCSTFTNRNTRFKTCTQSSETCQSCYQPCDEDQYVTIFIPGLSMTSKRRMLMKSNQSIDGLFESMSECVTTTTKTVVNSSKTIDMHAIDSAITGIQVFPNGTFITLRVTEVTTQFTIMLQQIATTESFTECMCASQTCHAMDSTKKKSNPLITISIPVFSVCIVIAGLVIFIHHKKKKVNGDVKEVESNPIFFEVVVKPEHKVDNPVFNESCAESPKSYCEVFNPSFEVVSTVSINPLMQLEDGDEILEQIASLRKVHRSSINQSGSLTAKLRAKRRWNLLKNAVKLNLITELVN